MSNIGHNKPPRSPYEAIAAHIADLYQTAKDFCDGEPITTEALAAEVERLEGDLKTAIDTADKARKEEAKPFDDAKTEIQDRYNVLIGKTKTVTGTAILALDACKAALTPWKQEQLRIKEAAAAEARRIAEEKAEEARQAHMEARRVGDLEALEAAEQQIKDAGKAEKAANRAEKQATVGTGLRVTYSARIDDMQAFARYCWTHRTADLHDFLQTLADSIVKTMGQNAGGLQLPGVTIERHEEAR